MSMARSLRKVPTGIAGFDFLTGGGLPHGRPTLVTGSSGSGKTLFGIEFLVRGILEHGEPGVLLTFEESAEDLSENVASLGFDLDALVADGKLVIDAFHVDTAEIVATGAYDLEGLFLRLACAVEEVGAKRVHIDTLEALFSAFNNEALVRSELVRLFRWLKDRELTTVVTGERGREGQLTRFGIEEYVSDCVVVLDHRVHDEISTRRLRVTKYRGSVHGTNEYPFLITDRGFLVLPLSELDLTYAASEERISTGVPQLDAILGGGVYRGSTLLISGTAGTGKTTLAAHVMAAACARGERALFLSFEESPAQMIRNMRSVGIDLERWVQTGMMRLLAERATAYGLEAHLGRLQRLLDDFRPEVVVLDAMASLTHVGTLLEVTSAVAREVDLLKTRGITAVVTTLNHSGDQESSTLGISSLTDTWLVLRNTESPQGQRQRRLFVVKSRGTAHSNDVFGFRLTDQGAQLEALPHGPQPALAAAGPPPDASLGASPTPLEVLP